MVIDILSIWLVESSHMSCPNNGALRLTYTTECSGDCYQCTSCSCRHHCGSYKRSHDSTQYSYYSSGSDCCATPECGGYYSSSYDYDPFFGFFDYGFFDYGFFGGYQVFEQAPGLPAIGLISTVIPPPLPSFPPIGVPQPFGAPLGAPPFGAQPIGTPFGSPVTAQVSGSTLSQPAGSLAGQPNTGSILQSANTFSGGGGFIPAIALSVRI